MNSARVYELGEVPADARLPTEHGDFRIKVFHEEETGLGPRGPASRRYGRDRILFWSEYTRNA